ncbi:MAG: hypothetical protein PHU71_01325 [Candidatus Gracilibacteria bacterium]|nr:hypothetical protein [Candidatus Gracilibacteria bacterium]
MKKKTILASSLATLSLLAFASSALAWGGPGMGMKGDSENFQAMQDALTNKDYSAWQELMSAKEGRQAIWTKFISEDEFASFAEQSMEQVNTMQEHRDAVSQAITDRDYETWKSLMSEHRGEAKVLDKVTADNFDKFAEAMELAQSGDLDGAKEIRDELGLSLGKGMHRGRKT